MPYLSYVKVNLRIPPTALYIEDILMLVINDSKYGEGVLVQLDTTVIDKVIGIINLH